MVHLLALALIYAVHASYECREHCYLAWLKQPRWTWVEKAVPWCIVAVYLFAAVMAATEVAVPVTSVEASYIEL